MAKRIDKIVDLSALWLSRLALSVLAFAGMMHLLGGIDSMIAYPISGLAVALLLKETL